MKAKLERNVTIPAGVQVSVQDGVITVTGPKGENKKTLKNPKVAIAVEGTKVKLLCPVGTKREKMVIGTFEAHLANMIKGVQKPFHYKLKICSGHFPMTVAVTGTDLVIKNFIGGVKPLKTQIKPGVSVKVNGDIIEVESCDRELAGQVSADIEKLTRRPSFDNRIFQDGIYIIEKAGRALL